jgi:hypothetical protein
MAPSSIMQFMQLESVRLQWDAAICEDMLRIY